MYPSCGVVPIIALMNSLVLYTKRTIMYHVGEQIVYVLFVSVKPWILVGQEIVVAVDHGVCELLQLI